MEPAKLTFAAAPADAHFAALKHYSAIFVLVDANTVKHCYPLIEKLLPPHKLMTIGLGEQQKTLATCEQVWQQLTDAAADRKSVLLNLGGGLVGDLGGFCAATYKRGIDFWQLPTSLLAQVDASVGGKVGVNFAHYKNHIGSFEQPKQVLVIEQFLQTLPPREFTSGLAEMLKHGLIYKQQHWEQLQQQPKPTLPLIQASVAIKEEVVIADPTEKGLRKILNFGHTLGHALESYLMEVDGRAVLHGEAVAAGMLMEAYLSHTYHSLPAAELAEIAKGIDTHFQRIALTPADVAPILQRLSQDKKNSGGKVSYTLLKKIGAASYDNYLTVEQAQQAVEWYTEGS